MGGPDDEPQSFAENASEEPVSRGNTAKTVEYLKRLGQGISETNIEKITRQWRKSLAPILAEEEKRDPFDIRKTIDKLDDGKFRAHWR